MSSTPYRCCGSVPASRGRCSRRRPPASPRHVAHGLCWLWSQLFCSSSSPARLSSNSSNDSSMAAVAPRRGELLESSKFEHALVVRAPPRSYAEGSLPAVHRANCDAPKPSSFKLAEMSLLNPQTSTSSSSHSCATRRAIFSPQTDRRCCETVGL
jgi:hypothetical protein